MAVLRYLDDAGCLQSRTLDAEQFVIGRAPTCQITFDDDMISREHLRIDIEPDGRFRVRDLGSRNKTYVNGELTSETLLMPGDVIRTGDRIVEFLDDAASPEKIDLEFLTPDRTEPPHCEWVKLKAPLSLTLPQVEQLAALIGDQALTARPEDIANAALGQILLDLQAERGLIALRGDAKTELRPLAQRGLRRPPGGSLTPVSQSFALAPILQSVGGRYPQTASQLNNKLGYAVTALAAPLTYRGDLVGVLYLDRPASKKPFAAAALQYGLAAAAQVGALIGETARKLVRNAAREGVAWISTLRRVQGCLTMPVVASDGFDAAMKLFPGRVRCGDFGEVIHLDEQRCCVLVVDGGGHGITGIVQANALRAAVRAALAVADDVLMDPAALFNQLNRTTAASASRQVVPCTFAGIDMSAGKLVYINAGGMPPLLLIAPGRLVTLDQPSLVLGVDPDCGYEATRVDLPEAFRLVCHTDGLVEVTSVAGEALGEQRLHDVLLHRDAFGSAAEVVARVAQAWSGHLAGAQPDDDALVLAVSRGG
ncbi:MAG: SpoIIE family protein phosphatase [Planctomycetes bacterium]|nr:SpoIIE family protein phosphatase [Planctomycetota bacterium]